MDKVRLFAWFLFLIGIIYSIITVYEVVFLYSGQFKSSSNYDHIYQFIVHQNNADHQRLTKDPSLGIYWNRYNKDGEENHSIHEWLKDGFFEMGAGFIIIAVLLDLCKTVIIVF